MRWCAGNVSKRSDVEEDGDSSSVDMAKTPSLGTRRWLRRRWAGVGVEHGVWLTKGNPDIDASGAVRGASPKNPCCHVTLAGTVETSRMGVVGGVMSLSSPKSEESSQIGNDVTRVIVMSVLARRAGGRMLDKKAGCKGAAFSPLRGARAGLSLRRDANLGVGESSIWAVT